MATPRERAIEALLRGDTEGGWPVLPWCPERHPIGIVDDILAALEAAGLRIVDVAEDDARAVQHEREE